VASCVGVEVGELLRVERRDLRGEGGGEEWGVGGSDVSACRWST
jgi:hypothetical protein